MKLEILALVAFSWYVCLSGQVNCQTLHLIKQYFECRNLTMVFNGQVYVPDPTIPNNYLDDSFYESLGLANMTLDEGMDLIKKIFTDTQNCDTLFCNCVSWGFIDPAFLNYNYQNSFNSKYSIYFRNNSNFPGVKSIVSDFYNEYKWNIQSPNETYMYSGVSEYPTIIEFLLNFEFSEQRINTFRYQPYCSYSNYKEIYDACIYMNSWKNGTFITNPTNPTNLDLENQMVCELMRVSRGYCSIAYQRIQAMWIWASQFPKLKYTGSSLSAYFDNLLQRSRTYIPSFEYAYQTISISSNYISTNGYYSYSLRQDNETKFNFVLLNSSLLRIDCLCEFVKTQNMNLESRFSKFNFTFYSASILRYNIDTSSYPTSDGTIFKDSNGKNIFQVFNTRYDNNQITIYHFDSKSKIIVTGRNGLSMYSHKSFFNNAYGFIVGDPINMDTSNAGKRKKREAVDEFNEI